MTVDHASFAQAPLTPVSFLERAGTVFADRVAVVDGDCCFTYAQFLDRARRMAGLMGSLGLGAGDRVAVVAPNSPLLLEAHYGLAMAGLVLVACNTRLAPQEIATILDDAGIALLLAGDDFQPLAEEAAASCDRSIPILIAADYERRLAEVEPAATPITDELATISINDTSGTTGNPKGAVYSHRGTYLQAMAMAVHARLGVESVYLWTLPMFHCNGWTFTWAVTAVGGTHVCLRSMDPDHAWELIREHDVSHFCAAPTVLSMLAASSEAPRSLMEPVRAFVGGAPPTPTLLEKLGSIGVQVTHLYGLTESLGPSVVCEWRPEWDALSPAERAVLASRQGVGNVSGTRVSVVDEDSRPVPWDGATSGEILLQGNTLMMGYYDSPEATAKATADGWFRTGDLAVVHPNGYLEIRDRAKDVIISGGENISSIEVERVLVRHEAVSEAAVVGAPDETWGERPVAFVTLETGSAVTETELRDFARESLAGFKVPDRVVFCDLPKSSTGKIQKNVLRDASTGDVRSIARFRSVEQSKP